MRLWVFDLRVSSVAEIVIERMYEESRTPWWTWLLAVIAIFETALVLLAIAGVVDFEGSAIAYSAVGGGAILFWFLLFVFGRYFVELRSGQLQFGYRFWNVSTSVTDIRSAREENVTLRTFGGLGWRMDLKKRIGYVPTTGSAVELSLHSGRTYVASCDDPSALMESLSDLGVSISDEAPETADE